jgi:Rieske Fe-S protein
MDTRGKVDLKRREMIRAVGWISLIPLAGIWDFLVRREQIHREGRVASILLADIQQGTSFFPDYWIKRENDSIVVFSTRCSHLGCKIQQHIDGSLICPCHGSRFDKENGSAIKGPAQKPLQNLNYIIEGDHLTIFIK